MRRRRAENTEYHQAEVRHEHTPHFENTFHFILRHFQLPSRTIVFLFVSKVQSIHELGGRETWTCMGFDIACST